jgi:hypothetical protein
LPLSRVAQSFLEQLERDYGAALVHVCCKCEEDRALESNALLLFNEDCAIHGRSWHRLMMRQPDGSLTLAMPLDKNRITRKLGV